MQYVEVVEPNSHVFFWAVFWGFVKATGIGWVPFLDGSGHVVCIVTTQGTLSRLVVGWLLPLNKKWRESGFQKRQIVSNITIVGTFPRKNHQPGTPLHTFFFYSLPKQFGVFFSSWTMIVLHSFLEKTREKSKFVLHGSVVGCILQQ